jgi:hypothetical protein
MVPRRGLFGLTLATLGCAPPGPGFMLDDEAGTSDDDPFGDDDPSTDGESSSEGDTGGPNDIPFELVSAAMDATGQYVALRFSEPVAPVEGVDPSDFRISFGGYLVTCDGNDCLYQTRYIDPNFYVEYYILYPNNPNGRFEVELIAPGNQVTDVFLRFELPLNPSFCEFLALYPYEYGSLFVHHSPGGIPVRSSDGELLEGIGAHWVEQPELVKYIAGNFVELDPKIPIPCTL